MGDIQSPFYNLHGGVVTMWDADPHGDFDEWREHTTEQPTVAPLWFTWRDGFCYDLDGIKSGVGTTLKHNWHETFWWYPEANAAEEEGVPHEWEDHDYARLIPVGEEFRIEWIPLDPRARETDIIGIALLERSDRKAFLDKFNMLLGRRCPTSGLFRVVRRDILTGNPETHQIIRWSNLKNPEVSLFTYLCGGIDDFCIRVYDFPLEFVIRVLVSYFGGCREYIIRGAWEEDSVYDGVDQYLRDLREA